MITVLLYEEVTIDSYSGLITNITYTCTLFETIVFQVVNCLGLSFWERMLNKNREVECLYK